jgi:hypothetical protein
MTIPALHRFADGRLEATCGRCMSHSIAIVAADEGEAWALLVNIGWSLYTPETGVRSYSLCPACTTYPEANESGVETPLRRKRR